ncbi:Uncharacterised protein [Streptococcus pneumoniae]|nr:Uncharacterised protein [Streptococcus pneumoniae]
MKDYKINFDLGKIEYFDNNCLIQVYKFISFYDICEMVFAFHLPPDELITNVIFKEKINSMLKCYIDRLLYVFINPTHFTEKVNLLLDLIIFLFLSIILQLCLQLLPIMLNWLKK